MQQSKSLLSASRLATIASRGWTMTRVLYPRQGSLQAYYAQASQDDYSSCLSHSGTNNFAGNGATAADHDDLDDDDVDDDVDDDHPQGFSTARGNRRGMRVRSGDVLNLDVCQSQLLTEFSPTDRTRLVSATPVPGSAWMLRNHTVQMGCGCLPAYLEEVRSNTRTDTHTRTHTHTHARTHPHTRIYTPANTQTHNSTASIRFVMAMGVGGKGVNQYTLTYWYTEVG